MTTLGHGLTGLTFLTFCLPPWRSWPVRLLWAVVFISLANIPDWPLPNWGHHRLAVSHSLWVNLVLCTALAAVLWRSLPAENGRYVVCGALAWQSHLLLDTLYGDQPGAAIYWPFSDRLAALPLPWLRSLTAPPPPFDPQVVDVLIRDALTFGPLLLAALWIRHRRRPLVGRQQ